MNNLNSLHVGFRWSNQISKLTNTPSKFNLNLLQDYIRSFSACLTLFIFLAVNLQAQTPQYYNFTGGSNNNAFPFNINSSTGKTTQTLYLPGAFNQPTTAPAGNITKLYIQPVTSGSVTYTQLTIKMALTTDADLPTGAWFTTGMTTVFDQSNYAMTTVADQFVGITLTTPFTYDPTKSLVVEITQCGYSGTGFGVRNTTVAGTKRHAGPLTVVACPHTWGNSSGITTHTGLDIAPPTLGPNMLYYKFENNPTATSIFNCAVPGVGNTAPILTGVTLGSGGQFDTALVGTGIPGLGATTGWSCNLGTSSWTISMWLSIPTETDGAAYYLFGDAGSGAFRCFHNGVALPNNLVLRGGFTDVTVTGTGPNPTVVTFVYDSTAGNIKAYKNGVLAVTSPQVLNITAGTGFYVGGYAAASPTIKGKMDEFRMYRRALTAAEVLADFNQDLPGCGVITNVTNTNHGVPTKFVLKQNYPNPFNPVTKISFDLPKSGFTTLIVYDIMGREVKTLVNTDLKAGNYDIDFKADNFASGTYLYTLSSGDFKETKKMVVIK